MNGNNTVLKC